jgi:hypothetical protein
MVCLTDVLWPRRDAQIFARADWRAAILRLGNGLGAKCPEMGLGSNGNFEFLGREKAARVASRGPGGRIERAVALAVSCSHGRAG